jgi:hypothetical protein
VFLHLLDIERVYSPTSLPGYKSARPCFELDSKASHLDLNGELKGVGLVIGVIYPQLYILLQIKTTRMTLLEMVTRTKQIQLT